MAERTQESEPRASKPSLWNSLEIAKLIVAAITPLTIGAIGAYISWHSSRASLDEAVALQRNQLENNRMAAIYAQRQKIWDDIGPRFEKTYEDFESPKGALEPSDKRIEAWTQMASYFDGRSHYFSHDFRHIVDRYIVDVIAGIHTGPPETDPMVIEADAKLDLFNSINISVVNAVVPCELGTQICDVSATRVSVLKKRDPNCQLVLQDDIGQPWCNPPGVKLTGWITVPVY